MLQKIVELVKQAGAIVLSANHTRAEEKTSFRDLVTQYDRQVQDFLQRKLLDLVPEAVFLGEETAPTGDIQHTEWLFIVDPIDGTTNYVQGFHNSCISVGLMHNGQMEYGVVYNPYDGETYCAQRSRGAFLNGRQLHTPDKELLHSLCIFGTSLYYPELCKLSLEIFSAVFPRVQDVRRFGAAALDFCYVAAGKAGAFFECRLCPWDFAAGSLIASEAGAAVTALGGAPLDYYHKCSVAVGSPRAHRQLVELAAPYMLRMNLR